MIPNITRGDDFHGLMRYLAGPGRANEHELPHLVAGDGPIMTWYDTNELSQADARAIATDLNTPTQIRGGGPKAGRVWHCSLSLPASDGRFTDEQWNEVATKFLDKMGWSPEVSGRSPMGWAAVHHGLSKNGNDHIHLVVSMVREDGTLVNTHNDRVKAQAACRELEAEYGIRQIEGTSLGVAEPGLTPAEQQISKRTQREPSRVTLERSIRAAATMSNTEAEFVNNVRGMGIRIAPYFAQGRNDVVAGYRVGLRGDGERMFGGGHLSRELTLPRLRQRWVDSPESHLAAADAWRTADRADRAGQPAPAPRGRPAPTDADFDRVNLALHQQRERLRTIGADDTQAWAEVAQDTAGVLAAWSRKYEGFDTPGPIWEAARNVRRLGQIRVSTAKGTHPPRTSMTGAALLAHSLSVGGQGKVGQAIFLRQLLNTMKAVHDASVALGQLRIAEGIAQSARDGLNELRKSLPTIPDNAVSRGCPTVAEVHQAILVAHGGTAVPETPRVAQAPLGRPIPNRPAPQQAPPTTAAARPSTARGPRPELER